MIAADGQEPADLVPRLADAYDGGARIALAARRSRADSLGTRISSALFYHVIRLFGLSRMPKKGFDAFLLDKKIVEILVAMKDPNVPLPVVIAWLGYDYAEVEYDRLERLEGRSRWTLRKRLKYAIDAITAVSYTPIRAISLFGTLVAIAGFLYAIFVVIDRIVVGSQVRGWTSLFVAVLVIGGTQLLALGVIGEYLWRTLEFVRNRPLWLVSEVRDARPQGGATSDG
jgi:dolichol-phosphate mannosyltransferase